MRVSYAHNAYLQLLAEYGAVGAALFLAFLVLHLGNRIAGAQAAYRRSIRLENNQVAIIGLEHTLKAVKSSQATQ